MAQPAASELAERAVREAFAASPLLARSSGEHSRDGELGPVGAGVVRERERALDRLAVEVDAALGADPRGEDRVTLASLRLGVERERFSLRELRHPFVDPGWWLVRGADVATYVFQSYAPAAERAEALRRHLLQLPQWLAEAATVLEPEVLEGPRALAVDAARGHASFYRDDVLPALGVLPGGLARDLAAALEAAALACEEYGRRADALAAMPDSSLGEARFCALLAAQEGIQATAADLAARADAELERLGSLLRDAAGAAGATSVADVVSLLESDRPTATTLVGEAAAMLARLRDFWVSAGALTIPGGAPCEVRPTPPFFNWSTASYLTPGAMADPGLPHFYYVTGVQDGWSAEQAEGWLRHLNRASLENISVHEVFPGHYVQELHAAAQADIARRVFWCMGLGEGWAHYTEELAVEHGLADGRPLLLVAQLQDALLRACRMRGSVGLHCEGWDVTRVTRLFQEQAHLPLVAAEREAKRATYDPMYLVYTLGKLEIQRWRAVRRTAPGYTERGFHDELLALGYTPLSVAADALLGPAR